MKSLPVFAALSLLALGACDRRAEPAGRSEPSPSLAPAPRRNDGPAPPELLAPSPAPAPATAGSLLEWSDPPGWTRVPSQSAMRLATYKVPRGNGDAEDAELTVFHFPGGGGVDANFERWKSQFQALDPEKTHRSDRTNGNLTEHVLEIDSGTFASAMGPMGAAQGAGPKPNYGLIGAVIESPSGDYFFKLTGPAKTVKGARAAFLALLDGLKHP